MRIKKTIFLFLLILFVCSTTYAGFFPVKQYVEVNLKNYKNNKIDIYDENGNILETNDKGKLRLQDGTGESGSLIIEKGERIVIDNLYSAAQDVENDSIKSVSIRITNNNGIVNTINCNFEKRESKSYYITYDCDNGQTTYNNKEEVFAGNSNTKIVISVITAAVILSIICIIIVKKIKK